MNTIENYYDDNILIEDLYEGDLLDYEDDLLDYEEDLLDYDEDLLDYEDDFGDDDLLEDGFGEDIIERRRRGRRRRNRRRGKWGRRINRRHPRRTKRRSNFGKAVKGKASNAVSKAEFKKSLDSVSKDVNSIKKSVLVNNKALKALDGKYNDFVKELARKDSNQTKVLKNMQQMSMLSSLLNKPKFDESNLNVKLDVKKNENGEVTDVTAGSITENSDNKTVTFDQTMSLLLPMMTTMGDPKTGKTSNSEMMLPLVLLMNKDNDSNDNSMMLPLLLMTMNK